MTTITFWRKIMNYYSKTIWIWKIKINLHICLDINIYAYTHIYKITYLRILKAGTYKTNLIHTFIERVCLSYPNLWPHIKQTHRNIYYLHVLKIKKWNFYFRIAKLFVSYHIRTGGNYGQLPTMDMVMILLHRAKDSPIIII